MKSPKKGSKQEAYFNLLGKVMKMGPQVVKRENIRDLNSFRSNVRKCATTYGFPPVTINAKKGGDVMVRVAGTFVPGDDECIY